jgi:hypothetical protein
MSKPDGVVIEFTRGTITSIEKYMKFDTSKLNPVITNRVISKSEIEKVLEGYLDHPFERKITEYGLSTSRFKKWCTGKNTLHRWVDELDAHRIIYLKEVNAKYTSKNIRFTGVGGDIVYLNLDFISEAQLNNPVSGDYFMGTKPGEEDEFLSYENIKFSVIDKTKDPYDNGHGPVELFI